VFLTFIVGFITEWVIEPRLGEYKPDPDAEPTPESGALTPEESRGLLFAFVAFVGVLIAFGLLALPEGAPLRAPTGELIGNTPFMNGLIAIIMVMFLATGVGYGFGARTFANSTDVIKAIEKSMSGLGPLIFLFFVMSQFVAYFNYTNMGTIL